MPIRHTILSLSMQQQNYHNHKRYYIPHHFVFYGLVLACMGFCLYKTFQMTPPWKIWAILSIAFFLIAWLSFMLRQHYATMNQNRIVRLEMRLRYYILAQKAFDQIEKQLSFGQIAALRFAGDEELLPLIDRTLKENLSPDTIKRAVQNWQADHMRI